MAKYEIRKGGKVFAHWTDECMTPDRETLKSMRNAGYRLYIDGKAQR